MEVLILEDDDLRFYCMKKALAGYAQDFVIRRWSQSADMIVDLDALKAGNCVLSLDLHLSGKTPGGEADSGHFVVNALKRRLPFADIIIHSSSEEEVETVVNVLSQNGWRVHSCGLGTDHDMIRWAALVISCLGAKTRV